MSKKLSTRAQAARRQYNREWKRKHREHVNEYMRNWSKQNPEKMKAYQKAYWERKAKEQAESEVNPDAE